MIDLLQLPQYNPANSAVQADVIAAAAAAAAPAGQVYPKGNEDVGPLGQIKSPASLANPLKSPEEMPKTAIQAALNGYVQQAALQLPSAPPTPLQQSMQQQMQSAPVNTSAWPMRAIQGASPMVQAAPLRATQGLPPIMPTLPLSMPMQQNVPMVQAAPLRAVSVQPGQPMYAQPLRAQQGPAPMGYAAPIGKGGLVMAPWPGARPAAQAASTTPGWVVPAVIMAAFAGLVYLNRPTTPFRKAR